MSKVDDPLITTVIPTYRRPAMLRRAVASALAQGNVPLRVSVFDNASGDETENAMMDMARSDGRIRYFCHSANIGIAANFDHAMRAVETPFFSLLSDDDYLLPGFYERALQGLAKYPEAMFWAGITLLVDEKNRIWNAPVERWSNEGLFVPPRGMLSVMHGKCPTLTGIVFRREVLECVGSMDREVQGPADFDFILRVAATRQFVVEKVPVSVFTLNSGSFSATQPLSMFWPGWQKMFANIGSMDGLDDGFKAEVLDALRQDARHMLFSRGMHALAYQRAGFARDALDALKLQNEGRLRLFAMECLVSVCGRFPLAMKIFGLAYRSMEALAIGFRRRLQVRFSHLLDKQG